MSSPNHLLPGCSCHSPVSGRGLNPVGEGVAGFFSLWIRREKRACASRSAGVRRWRSAGVTSGCGGRSGSASGSRVTSGWRWLRLRSVSAGGRAGPGVGASGGRSSLRSRGSGTRGCGREQEATSLSGSGRGPSGLKPPALVRDSGYFPPPPRGRARCCVGTSRARRLGRTAGLPGSAGFPSGLPLKNASLKQPQSCLRRGQKWLQGGFSVEWGIFLLPGCFRDVVCKIRPCRHIRNGSFCCGTEVIAFLRRRLSAAGLL